MSEIIADVLIYVSMMMVVLIVIGGHGRYLACNYMFLFLVSFGLAVLAFVAMSTG